MTFRLIGAIASVAALVVMTIGCSGPEDVLFEGVPEQPAAPTTTSAPGVTLPPISETATTTSRVTTTSATTRSTLALSGRAIDELNAQVVVNGPLTDSVTILGPGADRLELFAAVGEYVAQPTWSPDGRLVAWARATTDGYSVVISPVTGGPETAYEAPFAVFYMQWRPDGRAVGLLGATEPGRVGLAILDLDSETVTPMNSSSSYYFHWSPEGDELITHLDRARLELLDPASGDISPLDADSPLNSEYQAAAWTPGGESILYVRLATPTGEQAMDELVIHDLESGEIEVLGEGTGFFNFGLSPDGSSVAYSVQNLGVDTSMRVVDLATGRVDEVEAPGTIAWQWSPDSRKILLLGVGTETLTMSVYEGGAITSYQNITPTETFLRNYLAFWGQYDLSHTLWSPDSSGFVYAAFDQDSNLIFFQLLDKEEPILLGPGSMAVFSPTLDRLL